MGDSQSKFSVEKYNNPFISLDQKPVNIFPDRLGKNTPGYTFDIVFKTGSDPPSRSDYTRNIDLVELLFYDYFRSYPSKGAGFKQPIGIPMRIEGMITKVQFLRANNEALILDPSSSEYKSLQIWSGIAYLNVTIGGQVVGIPFNDVSNCLYVLYRGASNGFKGAMSVSMASSAPFVVDQTYDGSRIVEQLAPLPKLPIAKVKVSFFVIPFSESVVSAYLADAPTYMSKTVLVENIAVKDATKNNLEVEASNLDLLEKGVISSSFSEFMMGGVRVEEVSVSVEKALIKFDFDSSFAEKDVLAGSKLSMVSSSSFGKVSLPLAKNNGPPPSRVVFQSDFMNWQKSTGNHNIFFWIDMRKELWEQAVASSTPKMNVYLSVSSKIK